MAGRIYGGGGGASGGASGGSNLMNSVFFQNQRVSVPPSPPPLFSSGSTPFLGSRSMVSFEDVNGGNRSDRSFFCSFDPEENGDEDLDEYFQQPEKKRRLKVDQVQFLEKSFEVENKLEPDRKVQLAKDLGLQPRQVAIWFQNRRARWKTKQLEKDYDGLHATYSSLKADYDLLLKEKEKLKAEVVYLTDKLLLKEKENGDSALPVAEALLEEHIADPVSDGEGSKVSNVSFDKDGRSSAKSDDVDSDGPHYMDGGHSFLLEPSDSSYIFERGHSDLSQDEDDNLSKSMLHPLAYVFPKIEDANYSDPPANSCHYGFPLDDHTFGFWAY